MSESIKNCFKVSTSRSIGKSYDSAIGQSYVSDMHTDRMAANHDIAIWDRIVEAVESIGIKGNPTHIGRLLGLSQPSVREWQIGSSTPSTANIREIAKKTGFYTRYIEDGKGPKRPAPSAISDPEWAELSQLWPSLNPKVHTRLLTIAQENSPKYPPAGGSPTTQPRKPKSN